MWGYTLVGITGILVDMLTVSCCVAVDNYVTVDTCVPGDMVTVSGVVKVTNTDEGI